MSETKLKYKVGIFSVVGLFTIGLMTVLVNDKPYWWRHCQLVKINIEDATGLKTKSPIRSLGLEIGYLDSVELAETHVTLGVCITAPVDVLPSTRAYIRAEGFLGDKFVELKPMRYLGAKSEGTHAPVPEVAPQTPVESPSSHNKIKSYSLISLLDVFSAEAQASEAIADEQNKGPKISQKNPKTQSGEREIPVGQGSQDMQQLVGRVDDLIKEMTGLTNNLKQALNPEDLKKVITQLNTTLENASKTLSPEGGLTHTAKRALSKLEDSFEQLRDMLTRINQGKGSLGMLINDPSYAEEIKETIKNANKLLSKVSGVRFNVDLGAQKIAGYDGGRGYFRLGIWPKPDRYYLLGISLDPRGKKTVTNTTVVNGGATTQTQVTSVEQTGIILTGMLGKVFFERIDLSLGALYGDGTVSAAIYAGPNGMEDRIRLQSDFYVRSGENGLNYRGTVLVRPYSGLYFDVGIDGIKNVDGKTPYFFGGGISFDDDDIKLLFALR